VPEDLLLRVLAKRVWLDDLHEAFMLRPSDDDGLSVFFDCTPPEAVGLSGLARTYGVASLSFATATGLGLGVTPEDVHHALVTGLPHKETDADRAEWLASRLAEAATIVDRIRREQ
jgi:hypothetical protein